MTPVGAREHGSYSIDLTPEVLATRSEQDPDLCVEVTVESGILSDMNVMLIDYPSQAALRCGFYWPGGKINEGDVFNVGFSLDGYGGQPGFCGSDPHDDLNGGSLVVLVNWRLHPKTDQATLGVRFGFVDRAP